MDKVKVPSVYTYRIYPSGKSKETKQAHVAWLFNYFKQSCFFYNKLLETYNVYFDDHITSWREYKKSIEGKDIPKTDIDYSRSPYMKDMDLYRAVVPLEGFDLLSAGAKSQMIRKFMRVIQMYFAKSRKAIESGAAPKHPRKDGRFDNWPRFAKLSDFCTVPIQLKAGIDFVDPIYNKKGEMIQARVRIGIGQNCKFYNVNFDRPLPMWAAERPVLSLMRNTTNTEFYISVPMPENETEVRHAPTAKEVGIDMGLKHFITTSYGQTLDLFTRKERALLMKEWVKKHDLMSNKPCHKLPRAERSKSYWTAHAAYREIEDRIKRIKKDKMYCMANKLVEAYDTIYIGKMDLKELMKKKPRKVISEKSKNRWMKARHKRAMRRNFAWSGMYTFIQLLKHVALKNNKTVIEVDERYTTMTCSSCGNIVEKNLSVRTHICPQCGLVLDRDHNAAMNMIAFGKLSKTEREKLNKKIAKLRAAKQEQQQPANYQYTSKQGEFAWTEGVTDAGVAPPVCVT